MTDILSSQTDDSASLPTGDDSDRVDMTVVSSAPLVAESGPRNSSFTELAKLLEGQQLDHFQLLETIGGGGMGVVFRAVDTQLGRTVAVKVLSRYEAGDEDALVRFKNEAQSAARLDHVNIARVYFVGEDKGWHYIVFEYIDGINVRDLVERDGPLSIADAVSFTLQIAEALGHASRRDVVHRDIKPSNVLITEERRAKLVDMGLARMHQVEHSSDDLTASGVTLGTFDYISPEQARDPRNADVRSDVYSLGCTLFFMLAGRPPFPEGTVLQKLLKHQSETPPSLQHLRPDLPAELLAVSEKMLAKKPGDRYQDAASLVSELHALAEKLGIRTGSTSGITIVQRRTARPATWTKHLPWLLPVATLAFAVVVIELFWSARASSSPPPPITGTVRATPDATSESTSTSTPPSRSTQAPGEDVEIIGDNDGITDETNAKRLSPDVGKDPRPRTEAGADVSATPVDTVGPKEDESDSVESSDPPSRDRSDGETSITPAPLPNEETPPAIAEPIAKSVTKGRTLIVGDSEMYAGELHYATLRAACHAAKSGDTIELRYDGARIERPIRFRRGLISIRAGKRPAGERYRPHVVFRPHESDLNEYGSGMFVVDAGATLRLNGVQLILDPGEVAAQQWSLVSLASAKLLDARNCWFTILNSGENGTPYHRDVAFFHVRPNAKGGVTKMVDPMAVLPSTSIQLADCVVRGDARVLQIDELERIDFDWNNGLCVTGQPFLYAQSGKVASADFEGTSQLALRHVTAMIDGGLCVIKAQKTAPYQQRFELQCIDSILLGNSETPLISQTGVLEVEPLKKRFAYRGIHCFYQGFPTLWRVERRQDEGVESATLDFVQWREHWGSDEHRPQLDQVIWRTFPVRPRPAHLRTPDEFVLADNSSNLAKAGEDGASDGEDVGMLLESIPGLAKDELTATDESD